MSETGKSRASQPDGWVNPAYGWYVVCVLTLAYTCAYIDRQILTLLIEPIRRDLHTASVTCSKESKAC